MADITQPFITLNYWWLSDKAVQGTDSGTKSCWLVLLNVKFYLSIIKVIFSTLLKFVTSRDESIVTTWRYFKMATEIYLLNP